MRRLRDRSPLLTAVAGLGATAMVLSGPVAHAATPQAAGSATWLNRQLDAGLVESEYYDDFSESWQSYTDFGLTLDVFFALDQIGVRHRKQARILSAIEPRADEYTDAWGTTYAGAIGKLLTAVQAEGIDPTTYASGDLLPRLESLVVDSGPEEGRGKDSPSTSDSSNSFGQSYVVTALAGAGSPETAAATRFLLDQQCGAGFFREAMGTTTFTCEDGSAEESRPDVDATATAVLALRSIIGELSQPLKDEVRLAARQGTRWLAARQVRSGTFAGGRNANSTGLAGTALAAAGRDAAAKKAARWLKRLRVSPGMARRTALERADIGAVAFNRAALRTAKRQGIERGEVYVWRRSTAQAAPALDAL